MSRSTGEGGRSTIAKQGKKGKKRKADQEEQGKGDEREGAPRRTKRSTGDPENQLSTYTCLAGKPLKRGPPRQRLKASEWSVPERVTPLPPRNWMPPTSDFPGGRRYGGDAWDILFHFTSATSLSLMVCNLLLLK